MMYIKLVIWHMLIIFIVLPLAVTFDLSRMLVEQTTGLRGWRSGVAGFFLSAGLVATTIIFKDTFEGWVVAVVSGLSGLLESYSMPSLTLHLHLNTTLTQIVHDLLLSIVFLLTDTVLLICSILIFILHNVYALLLFILTLYWLT